MFACHKLLLQIKQRVTKDERRTYFLYLNNIKSVTQRNQWINLSFGPQCVFFLPQKGVEKSCATVRSSAAFSIYLLLHEFGDTLSYQ